jgi:choline dehydrogenase-like flavoprotein
MNPAGARVATEVIRGREVAAPFRAKVDAVVVGSGSGGSIVARELAKDGRSVLVLEEGGYYTPEEYGRLAPSQSLRRIARESGLSASIGLGDSPLIAIMAGKCVGGSSVLTGGVCFRIPEDILHEWAVDLGLERMTPEGLDPYFAEIERLVHVETVPDHMRSGGAERFVDGAEKLGIRMKPLRRNTRGCHGASRCTFGCPHRAKMSVDISVLPEARERGAVVLADALVERVDVAGGRATGVRGRLLDQHTGEPRVPFEVRAKVVIVACGSLHTPLLLRKSGLDNVHIGRHVTLHPSVRVAAVFDEPVDSWDGALQSCYSDDFHHEGITLVNAYSAPSVLAAAFPGVGPEHRRLVKQMPNLGVFGALVHDEGGGTIRRFVSREPLVTYRMSARDRGRLMKAMHLLGQMAFAGGATRVLMPIFGSAPFEKPSELDFLVERPPSARRVECMSFHPLGSAKMATTERGGVVKPTGEAWQVDNLYVIDGSILPTSIGVNSQLPIMTVSLMLARGLVDDWSRVARRARYA